VPLRKTTGRAIRCNLFCFFKEKKQKRISTAIPHAKQQHNHTNILLQNSTLQSTKKYFYQKKIIKPQLEQLMVWPV
ncbi:hypothetical protein B0A58_11335, partial [Flavobacterium branchiophilum NBRC 15030 = ATCC 35035]